jgi:hypothetical protein
MSTALICPRCEAEVKPEDAKCIVCGTPSERRLRDVDCPQCRKPFVLLWNDYSKIREEQKQTLFISGCPSGGIYNVEIRCPHCDYEEEL